MSLVLFEQKESQRWNTLINDSINGTLFHTWEWLKIVEKHSGSKLYTLVYFDHTDDKPFGAIPIFVSNKFGLKMVFSPPPGTSITLGPVILDKGYRQHKYELAYIEFQSEIDKFIKTFKPIYTYILTSPGLLDIRPFQWSHYQVSPSYTYVIDLSKGEDIIWQNMSDSLKKNIKRAQKCGLQIVESYDVDSVDHIYASLERRYVEQNLVFSIKQEYMRDIIKEFKRSSIKVYVALYQGKIIGSTMCSIYKNTTTALIGGARSEIKDIDAMGLIRWEAIRRAIIDKHKWFELHGANTRHICNAKSQFCPEIVLSFQMKKSDIIGDLSENFYKILRKKTY